VCGGGVYGFVEWSGRGVFFLGDSLPCGARAGYGSNLLADAHRYEVGGSVAVWHLILYWNWFQVIFQYRVLLNGYRTVLVLTGCIGSEKMQVGSSCRLVVSLRKISIVYEVYDSKNEVQGLLSRAGVILCSLLFILLFSMVRPPSLPSSPTPVHSDPRPDTHSTAEQSKQSENKGASNVTRLYHWGTLRG
jgi:hypothetical protein